MFTNFLSAIILILFFYGRSLHKKDKRRHMTWMWLVIGLDILLVAYLAIFRGALSKIGPEMPWLLVIHLSFAVSTVFLYFRIAYVGVKLSKGLENYRNKMRQLDKIIIFTRVSTLVTSIALSISK